MLTRAEGRKQRRELDRQRAAALKAQARAKVKELRAKVKTAHAERRIQIADARRRCCAHRHLLKKRAKERRKRLLEELRAVTIAERAAARTRCDVGKRRVKESALSTVEKARHALQHERSYQADLKRIEANNRAGLRGLVKTSARERRSESDGEVATNIPPEFVPLWNRVKGKIKGSTRQSRTEAFLRYADEHAREVIEAQEDGVDAEIRKLEAQHAKAHRLARARRYTPAELAAVPF